MKYIECPVIYRQAPGEKSLFLAGGITGCPDWQVTMVNLLQNSELALLNPRRKNFDVMDPNIDEQQIRWEFEHLNLATAILFWFCAETLCPIALFEYGKWIGTSKRLFVGHDPGYQRSKDIGIQTELTRNGQRIHDSLDSLAEEVKNWAR
jgi:hypothetical protein